MNKSFKFVIIVCLSIFFFSLIIKKDKPTSYSKIQKTINSNWYFKLGDNSAYKQKSFEEKDWRVLNLPHDWSVEGKYDTIYGTDWQSGYLPAGIGWYRKDLDIDIKPSDYEIELQFDGIYMNSTIYVNGNKVGSQHYGYSSFFYNISKYLELGKNKIAVRVDHSKPKSGRWYTGSGIYRNVWLRIMPKAHFKTLEQYVVSDFLNDSIVVVKGNSEIINSSSEKINGKVVQKILDSKLNVINSTERAVEISPKRSLKITEKMELLKPDLWSLETPKRNLMVNNLLNKKGELIDTDTTYFGIRKLEFSANWGFKLNNKLTKIKGVCMHHAAGIYGAAVPESILLYRLQMLKDMGCNAIRTAHNPFSPEFYEICDKLGILVMDEIFDGWETEKGEDDYGHYFEENWQKDVTKWVKRDRNHPSVFMYSIGNEVTNPTAKTQKTLIDFIKNIDDTRPITQGGHDPTRGMKDQLAKTQLDVKGFNGDGEEIGRYEEYHKNHPTVPIIGTEVPHTYQTRGVYRTTTKWRRKDFPALWEINSGSAGTMRGLEGKCYPIPDLSKVEIFPEEKTTHYSIFDKSYPIQNDNFWKEDLYFQSSYDNATVRSSARKAWQKVEELDYVMGQFRWTAFDYLGETNQWPSRFANFGIIDIANLPKDHYYLYQSLWSDKPMVHILPHWTHKGKEGKIIPMVVYTNTEEVELFFNETSLGRKKYEGEQLVWNVPYKAGKISAKAYQKNKLVVEKSFETATGNHQLKVTANKQSLSSKDRENGLVFIDIVDEKGNLFPYAEDYITVSVSGAGKLKGVDNGSPIDLTPYTSNSKKAFRGKLVGFLEATTSGTIIVEVSTKNGLKKTFRLNSI